MKSATRVQILNEGVCFLNNVNNQGKDINLTILLPAMAK